MTLEKNCVPLMLEIKSSLSGIYRKLSAEMPFFSMKAWNLWEFIP
jgi:hypothetical protein